MPLYSIKHITAYKYHYPVYVSHHATYLKPMDLPCQKCKNYSLETTPACQDYRHRTDYFGNTFGLFSIQEEHQSLRVISKSIVEVFKQPLDISTFSVTCAEAAAYFARPNLPLETIQHVFGSPRISHPTDEKILNYARALFAPDKLLLQACADLMHDIKTNFTFDAKATTVETTVSDFFKLKRGVCQDFAHFAITILKAMGLPAKYVSGYILTAPPPGKPHLEGADASHAWVSVYVPEHGWIDFDPTNNLFCSDQHIAVAFGRDFDDVSPIRGAVTGGGSHDLDVSVTVKKSKNPAT